LAFDIIIFGAGVYGEHILRTADMLGIKVKFFVDNNNGKQGKQLLSVPIVAVDMLNNIDKIPIFIANKSSQAVSEIETQINFLGHFTILKTEAELLQFSKPNYLIGTQLPIVHNTYLEISTVIGCSVNCKMCPQALLIKNYKKRNSNAAMKMSFECFKNCIDKVPQEVEIRPCGMSEPFLNSDCSKMIAYAHSKGHRIGLQTTLTNATIYDIEQISHIHFTYIGLHLPDIAMNAKIPVTEQYKETLSSFLSKIHADKIHCNCHGQAPEEIEDILGKYNFKYYKPDWFDRAGNLKQPEAPITDFVKGAIYCEKAYRMLNRNILLPDGSVVLCCMDYGLKHILGNLLENTYDEILQGEKAQKIRAAFDDDKQELLCRRCNRAIKLNFGGNIV